VPLVMLLVMWIHIHRQRNARVNPPVGLAVGTLAMLLVLSFAKPAVSQAPADLAVVPSLINLDWFYLFAYPLLDRVPGQMMWAIAGGATLFLLALPWLPPLRRPAPARVDLENCNGCGRCVEDCPFSAVALQPRTDGAGFTQEAVVVNELCTSCGICVGACPTSTPFRRTTELIPGIDLPQSEIQGLRDRTLAAAAGLSGNARVILYGCKQGPDLSKISSPGVAVLMLPCIAMLPPPFLDFIIMRHHADGVFLTGCAEGDCHFRLGIQWMQQRLAGERDPYLRKRVPRERIGVFWSGITHGKQLERTVADFQNRLGTLPPLTRRRVEQAGERTVRHD
jgi:ferredoxin/coenzyme F420-reducing hydrogenase delta subunit